MRVVSAGFPSTGPGTGAPIPPLSIPKPYRQIPKLQSPKLLYEFPKPQAPTRKKVHSGTLIITYPILEVPYANHIKYTPVLVIKAPLLPQATARV